MGGATVDRLVVVAGVVVAAEALPVLRHDLGHGTAAAGQDLQPEEYGPETIFLADVVAAGAKAFFAAEGDAARIEQVAEEFPARGGFKAVDPQLLGHHIHSGAGGHRAGHTGQPSGVTRRKGGVGGEYGQAVTGIHKTTLADHHVAVAIAVAGGAKAITVATEQQLGEVMGVGEVGVGMAAAKILQGRAIAHRAGGSAQQSFEEPFGIGAGDRMHGIEGDREIAAQQIGNLIEIKQALHQGDVVVDPINHLYLHAADLVAARALEADGRCFANAIALQVQAAGVDRIGERFGRGAAVGAIHFDAEVALGASRVVAGRENNSADGAVLADQVGGGRGREDAAGGGDHPGHAVGGGHAQDHRDGRTIAVASVAT